jgi:hypothetical protein
MMDPAFEAAAYALKRNRQQERLLPLIRPDDRSRPGTASKSFGERWKNSSHSWKRGAPKSCGRMTARVKCEPAVIGLRKTVDPALFKVPS